MARINGMRLWAVRDPSPASGIRDVLVLLSLDEMGAYVRGLQAVGATLESERTSFYDDEGEARRDAEARLEARRAMSLASGLPLPVP